MTFLADHLDGRREALQFTDTDLSGVGLVCFEHATLSRNPQWRRGSTRMALSAKVAVENTLTAIE